MSRDEYNTAQSPQQAFPLPPPPLVPLHRRAHDDYRRLRLPYCFKAIAEQTHTYLPVNRYYKPLGLRDGWYDYHSFHENFVRFTCDPHEIDGVWFNSFGRGDTRGLYLYYDNPFSLKDYGARYGRLLQFIEGNSWPLGSALQVITGELAGLRLPEARRAVRYVAHLCTKLGVITDGGRRLFTRGHSPETLHALFERLVSNELDGRVRVSVIDAAAEAERALYELKVTVEHQRRWRAV